MLEHWSGMMQAMHCQWWAGYNNIRYDLPYIYQRSFVLDAPQVRADMSYFIAPDTGNRYDIFGKGGGERLALEYNLNFLGQVPIGMEVREGGDSGIPVVVSSPDSPQTAAFKKVAEEVARQVSIEAMKPELVILSKAK